MTPTERMRRFDLANPPRGSGKDPEFRRRRARYAGLVTAARGHTDIHTAHKVYKDSFRIGHECRLCPRIDVPAGLTSEEIDIFAAALRFEHFQRLGRRSRQKPRISDVSGTSAVD